MAAPILDRRKRVVLEEIDPERPAGRATGDGNRPSSPTSDARQRLEGYWVKASACDGQTTGSYLATGSQKHRSVDDKHIQGMCQPAEAIEEGI
jgi:hypothetical protein